MLSKGLGALGGLARKHAGSLVKHIPVVGTGVALAGTLIEVMRNAGSKSTAATVPAIPGGGGGRPIPGTDIVPFFPGGAGGGTTKDAVTRTFAAWGLDPAQYGPQIDYWTRQIERGEATMAHLEADLPSAGGRRPSAAVMAAGMGAAPSWGNLARRAAPIVGAAAARVGTWIAIGGGLMGLYDAAGNLIATKKRSRRMNVLNPKALSRANRRLSGFRDVAVRSLKTYGYTVSATRSAKRTVGKKRRR